MADKKRAESVTDTTNASGSTAPKFTKAQILASRRWGYAKDALTVVLSADKRYTAADVEQALETFMKGKVK